MGTATQSRICNKMSLRVQKSQTQRDLNFLVETTEQRKMLITR